MFIAVGSLTVHYNVQFLDCVSRILSMDDVWDERINHAEPEGTKPSRGGWRGSFPWL